MKRSLSETLPKDEMRRDDCWETINRMYPYKVAVNLVAFDGHAIRRAYDWVEAQTNDFEWTYFAFFFKDQHIAALFKMGVWEVDKE